MARGRRACAGHVEATNGNAVAESRILPWHRRSSYEPDAPARGVPQSPRWRVGLVCAKDAKLSCRGNMTQLGIVTYNIAKDWDPPHDSFPARSTQHLPRSPPGSARCTSATSSTASYPWRELFALLAAQ